MDIKCVSASTDYCAFGRPEPDHLLCLTDLTEHLERANEALLAVLPSGDGLTGFRRVRFELGLARITSGTSSTCYFPPDVLPAEIGCPLSQEAIKWVNLRDLIRLTSGGVQ